MFAALASNAKTDDGSAIKEWARNSPPDPTDLNWVEISDGDQRLTALQSSLDIEDLCNEVDSYRASRLTAGFVDTVTGKTFQCDSDSRGFWDGVGSMAGFAMTLSPSKTFTLGCADNTKITLSAADTFDLLANRLGAWVTETQLFGMDIKSAIRAGNAPTDITVGWP